MVWFLEPGVHYGLVVYEAVFKQVLSVGQFAKVCYPWFQVDVVTVEGKWPDASGVSLAFAALDASVEVPTSVCWAFKAVLSDVFAQSFVERDVAVWVG